MPQKIRSKVPSGEKECGNCHKTKSQLSGNKSLPANQQKGIKKCNYCHKDKKMTDFYISKSPLFSVDGRVPVCKECVINESLNEDGSINELELNKILKKIDRPYYKDLIEASIESFKKENSYVEDEDISYYGKEILKRYFRMIAMRQDRAKSYEDSEKDGFVHQESNTSKKTKEKIAQKYADISESQIPSSTPSEEIGYEKKENLIYDDKWRGKYNSKDIKYLNEYYAGLERDYKIITENHRDYARKIAKASLQMDKAFDEMINGIEGADARYKNAREAFDTLSKSAKFSESTRSVNDIGISSFSKVAAMVEAHNWIPEHKPLKKDTIDEMIDYLSTITKSL